MMLLKLKGIKVVPLSGYSAGKKELVITFDDGYSRLLRYAIPVLRFFKYPFEVFICHDFLMRAEKGDKVFLTKAECSKVVMSGGRIQYHSKSHACLPEISDMDELRKEIRLPEIIRQIDPAGGKFFAYPHWRHDERVRQIVREE